MANDRRNFLKSVGTGAAAAVAVTKITEDSAHAAGQNFAALAANRTNNQIKLALELDGEFAGWLSSFEGGQAVGEVVEHKDGNGIVKKHIGNVKYEDINVSLGLSM